MSIEEEEPSMYDLADQFINLANKMVKQDQSGNVGIAIRYAAARYNVFEASLHCDDLAKEKEAIIDRYTADYRKMMDINIDQHIQR